MQWVVRNVVLRNVIFDIGKSPVAQWVEFFQSVGFVLFAQIDGDAGNGLIGALAGDPAFFAGQCILQWLDLANVAAGFAQFE